MRARVTIALGVAVITLLIRENFALATPALPFSPYGLVTVDGSNVTAGTQVSAWCGGSQLRTAAAFLVSGTSWYANLDVTGDDPETPSVQEGCLPAQTVTFKVGTQHWSDQAVPWISGASAITLTASSTLRPAPVIPDLTIARAGAAARLSWPDNVKNKSYEVWRGTAPYLIPGAAGASIIANAPSDCVREAGAIVCENPNAIGNPNINYFYLVRAGNATDASVDSRRVGEFSFPLTPGN
jgi:hypothetical protein